MRTFLAFLLLGFGISIAAAEDCSNLQTQTDMTICAVGEYDKADAELNASYKQIMARLKSDPDTAKLLVAAEKAWMAFRDAECTFANSQTVGGSIHPMMVAECREAITRKRIDDLKAYLNCEEGDLSCPVLPQ
jgi:uncharacterized protein YecT (DUF1311 family)